MSAPGKPASGPGAVASTPASSPEGVAGEPLLLELQATAPAAATAATLTPTISLFICTETPPRSRTGNPERARERSPVSPRRLDSRHLRATERRGCAEQKKKATGQRQSLRRLATRATGLSPSSPPSTGRLSDMQPSRINATAALISPEIAVRRRLVIERASLATAAIALLALAALAAIEPPDGLHVARPATSSPATSACEGARGALPSALFYELRAGAFPGSARPDVAVHVPAGFDATRRPGLILYFHGWQGCVAAALADDDGPCTDGGAPRPGIDLASQVDASGVNALLVAIEVRADRATGEPGKMAMPAGLRDLLRELFAEHLREPLGCALEVDALDRVVVVAHSGGYQAAAGALALGDVPNVTEVDLLEALYGADEVFFRWMQSQLPRFDARAHDALRFVDLYTCCGGTSDPSRILADRVAGALAVTGLSGSLWNDDHEADIGPAALTHPVVFQRVSGLHAELPRTTSGSSSRRQGFAHSRPTARTRYD